MRLKTEYSRQREPRKRTGSAERKRTYVQYDVQVLVHSADEAVVKGGEREREKKRKKLLQQKSNFPIGNGALTAA